MSEIEIRKITDYLWDIPKQGKMNVPGRIYASDFMMEDIKNDQSLHQVINVAHEPGPDHPTPDHEADDDPRRAAHQDGVFSPAGE